MDSNKEKFAYSGRLLDLRYFYRKLPGPLLNLLEPVRKVVSLLRACRVEVWTAIGTEIHSQAPLEITYLGNTTDTRNYWFALTFGKSFAERYSTKLWLWQIPRWRHSAGYKQNIILVETPYLLRWLSGRGGLFVPNWVGGWISIAPEDIVGLSKNSSLRSDLRVIRRAGLTYEVTKDPRAFDDFYYHMYVPYISKAHGNTAVVMPYELLRRAFVMCELLIVRRGDEVISGVLLAYSDEGPKFWSSGVRNGDDRLLSEGATAALYYFGCVYLSEKGYTKVNAGFSRPFMYDGVLRFKKKWNLQLSGNDSVGTMMKVNADSTGVRGFLLNNPFVFIERDCLKGAVFVGHVKTPKNDHLSALLKTFDYAGLSKVTIGELDSPEDTRAGELPQEFIERVEKFDFKALYDTSFSEPADSYDTRTWFDKENGCDGSMENSATNNEDKIARVSNSVVHTNHDLHHVAAIFVSKLLTLRPDERLLVYTDRGTDEQVSGAVINAAKKLGAAVDTYEINSSLKLELAAQQLTDRLKHSKYDVVCELSEQYFYQTTAWSTGQKLGTRFYSLQGLDANAFVRCFAEVDFTLMDQFGSSLVAVLKGVKNIRITTDNGTDIRCSLTTGLSQKILNKIMSRQNSYVYSAPSELSAKGQSRFMGGSLHFSGCPSLPTESLL